MMKNIVLIGMPGCGKTTLGRLLAVKLGRPFFDADEVLETREGRTVGELFAESEAAFRRAEARTVKYLAEQNSAVIATGGGVVKDPLNMEALKANGTIIFIDRSPEKIISCIQAGGRPLLASGTERIHALYEERISLYRKYCVHTVSNERTEDEALDALVALYEKNW